ncbi:hypothetical protein QUW58_23075 [Enterocloster aldenensis]|uniref:hypothetical protein n=1 Tax=Enterocloster aldenensis TaxID=358742 RepID=UPI0025A3F975|nr:hypothetical protein [Enterocloster aldenensis]
MRKGETGYLKSCELKKHIFCTTVFTRNFHLLLQIAKYASERDGRFDELCNTICKRAKQLLMKSAKDASHSTTIPLERLYRAVYLYNKIDEDLVAASIRHKIELYFDCLYKVLSEPPSPHLLFYPPGLNNMNLDIPCHLADEDICLELDDYVDEINAWLDIEFEDEYDNYCEADQGFDCYVELSAKLWMLSKLIRELN